MTRDRNPETQLQERLWGPPLKPLLHRLVSPAAQLDQAGDRRRAELLAGLLLMLVSLGALSGFVQLVTIPNFLPTFIAMGVALAVLTGAYAVSRTRGYRIAAVVTCLAPVGACLAVVLENPDDRVALSFMVLGALFATVFLSTRAAMLATAGVLAAVGAAAILAPPLRSPDRLLPVVAFQVIVSSLMLLAARQRNRVEADQEAKLREVEAALRKSEQQRRELDSQLSAAQHYATVGRLAAGLAHDLNNLLMLILGANANIDPNDGRLAAAMRRAEIAGTASKRLVRQMLRLARPGDPAAECGVVDLNGVVKEAAELLACAVGPHCELVVRCFETPLLVRADPRDMQRILLNLASNAGHAMPNGGSLTIEALPADGLEAAQEIPRPVGRYAAVVVADTGSGMPPDTRGSSVRPLVSSRPADGGTGLGLAIVADLVHRQGAALDVRSEPGRGTRFTILVPMA